jgi:tetratricopeptide (TPR) repeat protein
MNADSHTKKNTDKHKARLYFRLAVAFIFLLSLLWAADKSLAYCLLGSFLTFSYLSIVHYRRVYQSSPRNDTQTHQPYDEEKNTALGDDAFKYPNKQGGIPKPVRYVIIGFVSLFFFFFIVGIFSTSDDDVVESYYQKGEIFYNQGTYDSAKLFYRKVLRLQEDHQQALLGIGNTFMALEQYDSAVIVYDKVLEDDPYSYSALYQKGLVLYYAKKFDESIDVMKKLVEVDASYNEASQVIGDDFYNQKQYDSALVWYNQAYAGGLRNRYLCHLMGYIYDTKDSTARAASLYKEALEYDDSVVDIYIRLGELFPGSEGDVYRSKAKALQGEN